MLVRNVLASATVLAVLAFGQAGSAWPWPSPPAKPKTFTESKVVFGVTHEPTYAEYSNPKDGDRCLLPIGTGVLVVGKDKTDLLIQLTIISTHSRMNFSTPCKDGVVVRMSEAQFVDIYNDYATYNGGELIAVDTTPPANKSDAGD